MDIFKFNNPTHALLMEDGEIINEIDSIMWIERYQKPGEFEIKARASTGIRDRLSLGSFISRPDTTQIMTVENHEIVEERDNEPEVKITGRTFETILESRSIGKVDLDTAYPMAVSSDGYRVEDETLDMATRLVNLINDHIYVPADIDDKLSYAKAIHNITSGVIDSETKRIPYGNLYERANELLSRFDYDLRSVRPGSWNPIDANGNETALWIYEGIDRSPELFLSYELGDTERAEYLWSLRNRKTAAHVVGKWYQTIVFAPGSVSDHDRQYIQVNGSDVDGQYSEAPAIGSPEYNTIISDLNDLGLNQLSKLKGTALVKSEISETFDRFRYRKDFEVGDLITLLGNYETQAIARITEYVEILDETGFKSYPVLSIV